MAAPARKCPRHRAAATSQGVAAVSLGVTLLRAPRSGSVGTAPRAVAAPLWPVLVSPSVPAHQFLCHQPVSHQPGPLVVVPDRRLLCSVACVAVRPRRAAPRPRPSRGPFHRRPVSHQPARTELLELCGCARAADLPVPASQACAAPARGPRCHCPARASSRAPAGARGPDVPAQSRATPCPARATPARGSPRLHPAHQSLAHRIVGIGASRGDRAGTRAQGRQLGGAYSCAARPVSTGSSGRALQSA